MQIRNSVAEVYRRTLDLRALVGHRSLFLFWPRQTGKSSTTSSRPTRSTS